MVDSKSFRQGTWGAEIVDTLTPAESDIVVEGKRGLDAFASTNLDFILRSRGITNIVLGGFLTNCCVESTMRTAYEKGYNVVTLTDCTATLSDDEQRLAVEKNYPMFSRPMKHDEFLGTLEGRRDGGRRPRLFELKSYNGEQGERSGRRTRLPGGGARSPISCRRSSVVEQLFRKQQARGSSPRVGSISFSLPTLGCHTYGARLGVLYVACEERFGLSVLPAAEIASKATSPNIVR